MGIKKEKHYQCKIKYFDDSHFQVVLYSHRNKYDFERPLKEINFEQMEIDLSALEDGVLDMFEKSEILNDLITKIKRSIKSSRNRAKNKIYDYARSNDFEWFVTMTFNPKELDSFDYNECSKKLSKWLNNIRVRYAPDLQYLFVPELHKSGRYHFHGLISNIGDLKMVESGHYSSSGQMIYNIGNYNLGFTTATKILDKHRTATYIGKYITKELSGHIKGKKHYWASRNLNTPVVECLTLNELSLMGVDREFLHNNSEYEKCLEFSIGGVMHTVTYFEFEKN
jgi:hypothetical protein